MHLLSEGQIKCFCVHLETHSVSLTWLHQHYCGYWNYTFFLCPNCNNCAIFFYPFAETSFQTIMFWCIMHISANVIYFHAYRKLAYYAQNTYYRLQMVVCYSEQARVILYNRTEMNKCKCTNSHWHNVSLRKLKFIWAK